MLTAILVGLAMGVTVSISHAVGAENHTLVERTIGNTITLFACISIVSTFLLLIFVSLVFFTGKVSLHGRSPFSIIAHYGGLSAPALSVYLNSTSTGIYLTLG